MKSLNPVAKRYLISLLNALLSGAAASLGSVLAGTTLRQGVVIVGTAMLMSAGKWYAQHPIPGGVDENSSSK